MLSNGARALFLRFKFEHLPSHLFEHPLSHNLLPDFGLVRLCPFALRVRPVIPNSLSTSNLSYHHLRSAVDNRSSTICITIQTIYHCSPHQPPTFLRHSFRIAAIYSSFHDIISTCCEPMYLLSISVARSTNKLHKAISRALQILL